MPAVLRPGWLLLAAAIAPLANAQMGMEGMGMGSGRRQRDKEPLPAKGDLPCIKCDICEIVAGEIYKTAEKQRAAAPMTTKAGKPGAPKKEVSSFSEAEVNTIVTNVCNRRKEEGEWMWYIDLVESRDPSAGYGAPHRPLSKKERASGANFLQVYRTQRGGSIRKWDQESVTCKKSCDDLLDDDIPDVEDLVVPLWRGGLSEQDFKKLVCRDLTSRCGKARKAVPKKGRKDLILDAQEKTLLDTERMMENMKEQGMPMVMQSREDMMEELYEQMEAEGMSREEAEAFMDSVNKKQDDEAPADGGDAYAGDYDEEGNELPPPGDEGGEL